MNEEIIFINSIEDIHRCGVYMIFHCSKPHVFYVGSTGVFNDRIGKIGFARRFHCHIYDLRKGKHHSSFLQNIVNKYGINGLKMVILEVTAPAEAVKREQYYLDIMHPKLNTNKVSTSPLGVKRSDELKQRWSIQRKGRKVSMETKMAISNTLKGRIPKNLSLLHSKENREKAGLKLKGRKKPSSFVQAVSIPVKQLYNGNVISEFQSMAEAGRKTGISVTGINLCALGIRNTAGGYQWKN